MAPTIVELNADVVANTPVNVSKGKCSIIKIISLAPAIKGAVYVLELPVKECFIKDGSVLVPAKLISEEEIETAANSYFAMLLKFLETSSAKNMVITVHDSDEQRAIKRGKNVKAFLTDRKAWAKQCIANCADQDKQLILKWISGTNGWNCDPGKVDNLAQANYNTAINNYQSAYAAKKGLWCSTKEMYWESWHELIVENLATILEREIAPLPLSSVNFIEPEPVSCGETWTPANIKSKDYAGINNQRVEILLFEDADVPDAATSADKLQAVYGSPEYLSKMLLPEGYVAHVLSAIVVDEKDSLVPNVTYEVKMGDTVIRSGDKGIIKHPLPAGTYEILVKNAGDQQNNNEDPLVTKLLLGEFSEKGVYKEDGTGFNDQELQQLLEMGCGNVSCNASEKDTNGAPMWLTVFQEHLAAAPENGKDQQVLSRLMEAYYRAYFKNVFYTPENLTIPGPLSKMLKACGQSQKNGAPDFIASGMNDLKDPNCFRTASAQTHDFSKEGLWQKLIPTVKPLSNEGVTQAIPRIAAFLHDLGGDTADDYLSVICPPGHKNIYMANMSGCGLTTLFIWRTLGIADDELWRKYEEGQAIAYLLTIGRRCSAWVEQNNLNISTELSVGDCLLIGDPAENHYEHVLTVSSNPQKKSETQITFMGLNGGGTKNGKQHIANVQMRADWDAAGRCWRVASAANPGLQRKLRGYARTRYIPCSYPAYVVPYPGDVVKETDGMCRQVICTAIDAEKIARNKPFWTIADPESSVGALQIKRHDQYSGIVIDAIGKIADPEAPQPSTSAEPPPFAAAKTEKLIASGKVSTREKNSNKDPDLLRAVLGVPEFKIKSASGGDDSWVGENETLVLVNPGEKLHIKWLAQNYEKVVLYPAQLDLTELTEKGTPGYELNPNEYQPDGDGCYIIRAISGGKTAEKKVTIAGILEFKVTQAEETPVNRRPELLQRQMNGLKYGTPNFYTVSEVHALAGSFRELGYPDSNDFKNWWWGQISPHAESKLHWLVVGPSDMQLELAVNRKLNSKEAAATWDVTNIAGGTKNGGVIRGSKHYTWADHPAAAPDGTQKKINGKAQFIVFYEADLAIKSSAGQLISSAVIRLRENYEMPAIDEYCISYADPADGVAKGPVYPGGCAELSCKEIISVQYVLKGDHSGCGLKFVIQTLDARQKILWEQVIRPHVGPGVPSYSLTKDKEGCYRLPLDLIRAQIEERTECRAYLELFNSNGCVNRQG